MSLLRIDEVGLDVLDQAILETLIDKFGGGPVGLKTLGAAVGEDPDTLEEVYEPFLIQLGFVKRTPRGRVATPRAFKHIGREAGGSEEKLF
jgi:Holliday junction DNA helicase RuvB